MNPRDRAHHILERLGLFTPERLETIMALLDREEPSGFSALADAGLPLAAGGTTRQILDYIAPRLGKARMDRELRDYIMLPLREVGVLIKGYADIEEIRVIPHKWKPKSPNNVYLLANDFRELLEDVPDESFTDRLTEWEALQEERVSRIAAAEAAAFALDADQRLVAIAQSLYCPHFLPDYEVVFVDDTDGARVSEEWQERVSELDLPLDLGTRWPDVILNIPGTRRCWIVDCVETDGEIDPVRRQEMERDFANRGLELQGFTTVYRTARRFADRQRQVDNIAPGTYVWIAELGAAQFLKQPLLELGEEEELA